MAQLTEEQEAVYHGKKLIGIAGAIALGTIASTIGISAFSVTTKTPHSAPFPKEAAFPIQNRLVINVKKNKFKGKNKFTRWLADD